MLRLLSLLVAVGFLVPPVQGQAKPAPKKALLPDAIPGYKVQMIDGFTVAVSEDVLAADVRKFKRKPLEAIELDLKNICELFNDKGVEKLRAIPLWVEWDQKSGLANGRSGETFTLYYGPDRALLVSRNENPLKVNGVGLCRAKALTEVYQDTARPNYLQLLHVFMRAFQGYYLASETTAIRTAHRQAMAHKLYDKTTYCTTDDRSFFAEASSAYLDYLYYFPHGRGDIQKHDPATYKFLDGIWSKYLPAGKARAAGARPPDGSAEFRTDFKPADINLGPQLVGEKFDPKSCDGKVTLFTFWAGDDAVPLKWLKKWHEELGPFGFQVVILSADYTREKDDVIRRAETPGMPFPLVGTSYMPAKPKGQNWAFPSGHAAVYSAEGKWAFRGPLADGEIYLREAVGRKILKDAAIPDVATSVQPAVNALTSGEPIPAVMLKLLPATTVGATTDREQARKLMDLLGTAAQKRLDQAAAQEKGEPLEAYRIASGVATEFKGTPVAPKAERLTSTLKNEKTVAAELKARKDLEAVAKVEADLNVLPGSFSPKDPAFQKANAGKLKELKAAVERMRKAHPQAHATDEAEAIAKEFTN
ncbi:peroxiredoxin family protein [Limnoglobus roseus]|uniref:TlpA family protein disulfide reductase n=1 Tax=Limnoglobus roseus TaxID=2598579 RepID=A0A5C1AI03_9BACT|nr:peroxiredoxin family protein [Limnoglobus roseus]QEL17292.1 TlpA family protein disulfide reductase [Limnoglobus roseus]